ncbi:uncharacterized protein MAM_02120 [Metarhizium album ARSEF 1941]|uniref:Uncharacterized protein n=1 Tax=Metarhizium album (strain ARSEF 1941) TaxID=1081103 RepID=A0A0B2WVP1_METAS|nr:uncharacterized protein MAM_02120 [Metarhizium album ARSEF 1941]KHO00197.1 hypothetical protein MAM_02120 [Metarhizium album ARSEF 1941]
MDRPSGKLIDLALVSKYHPVANYSYPRKDHTSTASAKNKNYSNDHDSSNSRHSSNGSSHGRESLGSEGSAPGLIEDRTDSEVSLDDDYQYHAHTAELWDTFWPPRVASKVNHEPFLAPNKQYPALIASPRPKKQYICLGERASPSWPLATGSSTPSRAQTRKAAATYSPFPKLPSLPPTKKLPAIPVSKDKKPLKPSKSCGSTPIRPPRPAEALLTPCVRHTAFVPVSPAVADYIIEDLGPPRDQRSSRIPDEPSLARRSHCTIYTVLSQSATNLPVPEIRPSPTRAPRHFKSLAALPLVQTEQVNQEPHSVFEDDSDCEDGQARKFFGFQKRSDSYHKRRRDRSNTTPSAAQKGLQTDDCSPLISAAAHQKRHGHDVFGRLLGRRSR